MTFSSSTKARSGDLRPACDRGVRRHQHHDGAPHAAPAAGSARWPASCCRRCATCGGGICWMAWTERPQPRVSATSTRSFMTKRPRTSVCSGRPFTGRPCHGVILRARLQLGVVDRPARGRGRRPRCRHRRPAGSRPCADRGPRSWPDWRRSSARSRRCVMRPAFTSVSISGICVSTPGKPQSTVQMSLRVFSSARAARGRWRSMSMVPSASAAHSGSWLRASRTGGLTRMMPPSRA